MKIDPSTLPPHLRQLRANVRNFLLIAKTEELQTELRLSKERNDEWRARFVEELIEESKQSL